MIEEALLRHPAVAAAAAVGRPDRHSGEVPVAYVVPADPGQFDEAELLAWAGTAIGEPAARPKRIYPIAGDPGHRRSASTTSPRWPPTPPPAPSPRPWPRPAWPDAQVTAAHENGRLVVTVTGADPGRVRDAVAGFPLTVRARPRAQNR